MNTATCNNCGWKIHSKITTKVPCPQCGNELTIKGDPLYELMQERRQICEGCRYKQEATCALYLKPCSVRQLWRDQIPPPSRCPQRERFEDD